MKTRFLFVLSLLASLALPPMCRAHLLDTWYSRFTNSPAGSIFLSVAYGDGSFVAAGAKIARSTNGSNWTVTTPTTNILSDVTYGGGTFVAVGDKGTIVTSTNAINWEDHSTTTNLYLRKILYGNSRFVALGYTISPAFNYALVSTNGIAWNSYYVASNKPTGLLAFDNGVFVYPTFKTNLLSTDGITWTSMPSGMTNDLYMIGSGNNTFVAFDIRLLTFTSVDGTNWIFRGTNNLTRPESLAYGNGSWVAVGRGGAAKYSSDLLHWASVSNTQTTAFCVGFGNGSFITANAILCQSATVIWLQPVPGAPGAFNLFGPAGVTHAIQTLDSLNSTNWQTVTNLPLAMSPTLWVDPNPSGPLKFYRALLH